MTVGTSSQVAEPHANEASAVPSSSSRPGGSMRLVLLYVGLGPPIGALIVFVATSFIGIPTAGPRYLAMLPVMLVFSYPIAGIPALACGIVAAVASRHGRTVTYGAVAVTGFVASALFFVAYYVALGAFSGLESLSDYNVSSAVSSTLLFGLLGAAVAVICRRIGTRLHATSSAIGLQPVQGKAR